MKLRSGWKKICSNILVTFVPSFWVSQKSVSLLVLKRSHLKASVELLTGNFRLRNHMNRIDLAKETECIENEEVTGHVPDGNLTQKFNEFVEIVGPRKITINQIV